LHHKRQAIAFMSSEREDATEHDLLGIARRPAVFVEAHVFWQRNAEMGMQQHFTPLQRRGAHVENHRPISGRQAEAERTWYPAPDASHPA
jgi:hypothetical protein